MRGLVPGLFLVLSTLTLLWSQESGGGLVGNTTGNPLADYLLERDEMGRVLTGWGSKDSTGDSWFFGAQAMLLIRPNATADNQYFPSLASLVPALWDDVKYLSPRYLLELTGGALSSADLMCLTCPNEPDSLDLEERFIRQVVGYCHLSMLQGTIGDSLYTEILRQTLSACDRSADIPVTLIRTVKRNCGDQMASAFSRILSGEQWIDVSLDAVESDNDSLIIQIGFKDELAFPVEVLVVTSDLDSLRYHYDRIGSGTLKIPDQDIANIELDPDHILSEYFRYNNRWHRLHENFHIQPFFALPDWESYRIVVSPTSWSDWDGDRRYGVKLTSGFGVDLWPAYPSDYRHRLSLEISAHDPIDDQLAWGSRLGYGQPLNLSRRLFSQLNIHQYDDWQGVSLGLTKYIGAQTFLIQGSVLNYQRLLLVLEHDNYGDAEVWFRKQHIDLLKGAYTLLSLTRGGDRIYVTLRGAQGRGPDGAFSIAKTQVDLSGVFLGWLVGGIHVVSGIQSKTTPGPYQFTHSYAWQDGLSALPSFRGQIKISETTHGYLGLSMSGGYWFSWVQIKLFGSSMMYAEDDVALVDVKPRYAAGFGFEHKSIFTAGLYFPVWQSMPAVGENEWAWRSEWRFSWNL